MATLEQLHPVTGRCACGTVTYACSIETEVALSNGDELQIGKFKLVFFSATGGEG